MSNALIFVICVCLFMANLWVTNRRLKTCHCILFLRQKDRQNGKNLWGSI